MSAAAPAGVRAALREAARGAAIASAAARVLATLPRAPGVGGVPAGPGWERTNHRGRTVSLVSGPALGLGAALSDGRPAAAVAGLVATAVGAYDDAVGARHDQRTSKGFRGHLGALRRGQVTTGLVKVAGIGGAGLAAAVLAGRRPPAPAASRRLVDVGVEGALVAGCANLLNLLDLRPGRALKVGLVAAAALRMPGPGAAALVLLPGDLGERTMLGDAGANALGAVLGVGLAARLAAPRRRAGALLAVGALTVASEVVSYSRVIDAVPPLAWLDRLGRLP